MLIAILGICSKEELEEEEEELVAELEASDIQPTGKIYIHPRLPLQLNS